MATFLGIRPKRSRQVSLYRVGTVGGLTRHERDNVGWDLEATLDNRKLKLEVKGLSGSELVVELTPNEYTKMNANRDTFRLCTVTSALTQPGLSIFQFSIESGRWETSDCRMLEVTEVVSARCTASQLKDA